MAATVPCRLMHVLDLHFSSGQLLNFQLLHAVLLHHCFCLLLGL
jgi:hypothetical protein